MALEIFSYILSSKTIVSGHLTNTNIQCNNHCKFIFYPTFQTSTINNFIIVAANDGQTCLFATFRSGAACHRRLQ